MEYASDVWKDLRQRFAQSDLVRISELQYEIFSHKQGNFSIIKYFTHLKTLWEELENYRPVPYCPCRTKSACPALHDIKSYRDEDYVICFLQGLNDDYNALKSQILLKDNLPSLNKAFSMVVQHERQYGLEPENDNQVLVNYSNSRRGKGSYSGSSKSYNERYCTHCKKNGHTIEVCYQKHGLPPNLRFKTNSSANAVSQDGNQNESKDEITDATGT
uniref:Uncharacterized protein n=1 Tax=Cajanus cajan TaxID=3821 RepID=A0A151SPU4_CAJCA|nr:hypothetical protein KK1_003109 [Cajanus cajan]